MTDITETHRNEMTKIKEAAEVSLSIYKTIDGYRVPWTGPSFSGRIT